MKVVGLVSLFVSVLCLVSWVSEVHIPSERYAGFHDTPTWVVMDPPLYLSVPGFFVCLVLAAILIAKADL